MNYIQRGWLKVLNPIVTLVNDKLATRSGFLGKIGRFFAFGPRQFGYHPINKYFAVANQILVQNIGLATHRYSVIKNLTETGFIGARPHMIPSLTGTLLVFIALFWLTIPSEFYNEEGTSQEVLTNAGLPFHYSFLQDRVSAHYTEINSLYEWQMLKKFDENEKQILRRREGLPERIRKTKYARPGYKYIEAHTNAQ